MPTGHPGSGGMCKVAGCGRKHYAKGLCEKHHRRLRLRGSIQDGPKDHVGMEAAFLRSLKSVGDCIIFDAAPGNVFGHRNVHGNGKVMLAHRYAWERVNGPIPKDLCVCHNCPGGDNPACVNVNHLFLGTRADNTRDTKKKGRQAKGSNSGLSKLSEDDVQTIRFLRENKVSKPTIADMFGVTESNIKAIVARKTWRHVP